MDNEPITFLASFPNIQTAIRVAGDGGARILLDIAEDELPSIARLLLMRGIVLRVTVEPDGYQAVARSPFPMVPASLSATFRQRRMSMPILVWSMTASPWRKPHNFHVPNSK
jgi:hypothetical protein